MIFSASFFASICSSIFNGQLSQNGSKNRAWYPPGASLFRDLFWRSTVWCILAALRLPLGALLAPFWCSVVPFWRPFGSLWLPFSSLWLAFGTLWVPVGSLLVPFGCSWAHFGSPWSSIFSRLESPCLHFNIFTLFRRKSYTKSYFCWVINNLWLSHRFFILFMFFRNPLPESILGGSSCQPNLKSAILDPLLTHSGSKNSHSKRNVRQKKKQKPITPSYPVVPWADLDAIWRRKRSKGTLSSIWDRFCLISIDCWCYFPGFRLLFNINL